MTFSYGPLHMDVPGLADQQEPTYNSAVRTQGVVWKTYRERWMRGTNGERERKSRKSVLAARNDDNNDDDDDTLSCDYYHHHVVPLAQISLTFSRHFSLSFIASGRSSELHPLSSQNCCMYVRAGRPAFARPYVGIHRSTSLMSSSLLLQQCVFLKCHMN